MDDPEGQDDQNDRAEEEPAKDQAVFSEELVDPTLLGAWGRPRFGRRKPAAGILRMQIILIEPTARQGPKKIDVSHRQPPSFSKNGWVSSFLPSYYSHPASMWQ
jgi:hypothetical protein